MTNESKFETLAISSLPLGKGYRVTINLEHHVDVPLHYVNAHIRDFLPACAAFAAKMRDAINPPPKEESQAPDNPVKAPDNAEPFAWAIEVSEGVWSFTHMPHVARMWPQAEVIPLYRKTARTEWERVALGVAITCVAAVKAQRPPEDKESNEFLQKTETILSGLLERMGGVR